MLKRVRETVAIDVVGVAAVLGLLIVVAHRMGVELERSGSRIHLWMAPFYGHRRDSLDSGWRAAVVLAAVLIAATMFAAHRARAVWLPLLGAAVHGAWTVGLAWLHDPTELTRPMESRHGYLPMVERIDAVGTYWREFVDRAPTYPLHVRGHPPLFPLLLWCLDRVGLGGPRAAALAIAFVAASGVGAVVIVVRMLAGEDAARRVVPFAALPAFAPMVVASADAFFAGVAAWTIAAMVWATRDERRWSRAVAAGFLVGIGMLLSYGATVVALAAGVVALVFGKIRVAAIATVTALGVLAAAWVFGFSYFDGLAYVRDEYEVGVAAVRPFGTFAFFNLIAFAVMVGPAAVAGVGRAIRQRDAVLPVVALGLGMAGLALLSGMSKGEVERIWLSFAIWVVVAGAVFRSRAQVAFALGAQTATAVAFQFVVRSW